MSRGRPKGAGSFVGSYYKYDSELRRYLSRRLRNDQDARELAQEVWTRLLRVDNAEDVLEPLAYIYRAAANVISEFRMRQRREPVSMDSEVAKEAAEHPPLVAPDEIAEQLARQAELERVLASLPATYRRIVLLRICDGFRFREIGQQLGLPEGTARQYFFRAMTLIRQRRGTR